MRRRAKRRWGAAGIRRAAPLFLLVVVALAAGCARQAGPQGTGPVVRGDAARGEELFGVKGCIGCHTVAGIGGQVGPNLTEVSHRDLRNERPGRTWPDVATYIRESINTPQAYVVPGFPDPTPMPSAETFGLSQDDIEDIIAYLFSLSQQK